MKLSKLFYDFFQSEKISGMILVCMLIVSLTLSNTNFAFTYIHFWNTNIFGHSLTHWINDGLMAIFFLLIGLELKREIYVGELSNFKKANLPIIAALGGMLVPAIIFLACNIGLQNTSGAGIPMATDIAFALAVLSILGKKVATSLKIFLTAFAVVDDLGAIIIIAIFYTKTLIVFHLFIALGIWIFLLVLNKLRVRNLIPYLIGGLSMWYFMVHSGVHATIAGVLLAFAIPFDKGNKKSSSAILQNFLHQPVAFFILPLFAMANTCIPIPATPHNILFDKNSLGIILGLIIGKPLGILVFTFIGVAIKMCELPKDLSWNEIFGASILGGIGFTMSIFIAMLAYDNTAMINDSKIAILVASIISGISGYLFLKKILNQANEKNKKY